MILHYERCGRHHFQGAGDLGQATSALLGLLFRACEAHMPAGAAAARQLMECPVLARAAHW